MICVNNPITENTMIYLSQTLKELEDVFNILDTLIHLISLLGIKLFCVENYKAIMQKEV